mgnify:CR=1 FL=1
MARPSKTTKVKIHPNEVRQIKLLIEAICEAIVDLKKVREDMFDVSIHGRYIVDVLSESDRNRVKEALEHHLQSEVRRLEADLAKYGVNFTVDLKQVEGENAEAA